MGTDDCNVVKFEVDALMYVVLSIAEKHVPYGELVGTTECVTLYPRCSTNQGRYNRVKLYHATLLSHFVTVTVLGN
jgi:hypothetical protein